MATFISWSALYADMLNKLASRDFSKASADIGGGHRVAWTSADEFLRILEYVKVQANLETGQVSFRVHLKNGGRG